MSKYGALAAILLLVLKLAGIAEIGWWTVLAPLIVAAVIDLILIVTIFIITIKANI